MPVDAETGLDPAAIDFSARVADLDAIRKVNPHRFEFELLTAIVHVDYDTHTIVGFKALAADEFWARGHMPGFPLMPGVLMCEAAAQLVSYYTLTGHALGANAIMGLGGMDGARFHRPVKPGERLDLFGRGLKVHRRLTRFRVTGYVAAEKAFEVEVTGVPLPKSKEPAGA